MSIQNSISFTTGTFNRQALKRTDEIWISNQLTDENSLFLLFWENKFLSLDDLNIRFLDKATAEQYINQPVDWKYMGILDKNSNQDNNSVTVFATEITEATDLIEQANWQSLRSLGLHLQAEDANLLAY